MGTFNEFVEKLQNDQEFAKSVNDAFIAQQKAGNTDDVRILTCVAEEFGYTVTEEEIKEYIEKNRTMVKELDEEEMGKVAGGTGIFTLTVISASGIMAVTVLVKEKYIDKK